MPNTISAYPAVKVRINGKIRRFDNTATLTKAVRRRDIGHDSIVIYEESPNAITEMRADRCPMLAEILAQYVDSEMIPSEGDRPSDIKAGGEPRSPSQQPRIATGKTRPDRILQNFNAIRTSDDLADFDDIYKPISYRNDSSGDLRSIFRHTEPRFWLIPDATEAHKAYLVPGSEVLKNWDSYGLSAADNPLSYHFVLVGGERLNLRAPAVMVRDGDNWLLLKQGVLEGLAEDGAVLPPNHNNDTVGNETDGSDNREILSSDTPQKSHFFRNAMIILILLAIIAFVEIFKNDGSALDEEQYEVDALAPNICTGTNQGYVNADMASRALPRYIDRDTNIRAKAGVSSRNVGQAKRGDQFDLRRASDASSENWYQITSGRYCGHYIYSYAEVPIANRPPPFASYVNAVRTIWTDATIYDRPGGSGIGSLSEGSKVSLVGLVNGGFAEIIDAAQDNLLGYVESSVFDESEAQFVSAGLRVTNICPYNIRIYMQADGVDTQIRGFAQINAGESINVTNGRGREVLLADNVIQFFAEPDEPAMSVGDIRRWAPPTQARAVDLGESGYYELFAICS